MPRLPKHGAAWLLPLFLILLLGIPTLLYPYGRDQAMFAYVGAVWREGGLPYRDAWDVKLPAIYAVYALVGGVEWGPRLLDLFAAAAAVCALGLLGIHTARASLPGVSSEAPASRASVAGLLAGCLFLVYTLGGLGYWNLAQAETLIAPLSAGAVTAALRRRPLLAGFLAGCAAMFKTPAVLTLLPVVVAGVQGSGFGSGQWSVVSGQSGEPDRVPGTPKGCGRHDSPSHTHTPTHPYTHTWFALAGWLAPVLLVVLYFAARGGLPYLGELLATQAEYAGGDPRLTASPFQVIQALGLTGYLPLVGMSALALIPWSRSPSVDPRTRLVVAVWWFANLAQVLIQRRFYLYHWTVLTPAAAWLAADGLLRLWDGAQRLGRYRSPARAPGLLACVALVGLALAPHAAHFAGAAEVLTGRRSAREFKREFQGVFAYSAGEAMDAAAHIRRRSGPGDTLIVLSFEPEVYLYAGRRAPSRHASIAPIFGETSIRENRRRAWLAELVDDLRRRPPLYLVDRIEGAELARPPWAASLAAMQFQNYRLEGKYGRLRVFRRRE
jgi:hypothetical protein